MVKCEDLLFRTKNPGSITFVLPTQKFQKRLDYAACVSPSLSGSTVIKLGVWGLLSPCDEPNLIDVAPTVAQPVIGVDLK